MKYLLQKTTLILSILIYLASTLCFAETSEKPLEVPAEPGSPNQCYAYLTELVRSSSFPFKDWGIERKKVNLLVDQDDGNKIRARLFWETEGWGTMGWIEYDVKQKKLRDISAHLEKARKLSFDAKYARSLTQCRQTKNVHNGEASKAKNPLKSDFSNIKPISLPISMDQISILDCPIPDFYQALTIEDSHPLAMAAIDRDVVTLFFEGDTERWYLATLAGTKIIDYLLIGKSETVENEQGSVDNYIVFSIDAHKNISLEYSSVKNFKERQILKKEKYSINHNKKIIKSSASQ